MTTAAETLAAALTRTNTTREAFTWLDTWDHTCEPHATDLNEWRPL